MGTWTNIAWLVASALFIFGLKGLTHPRTAVRGNQLGALGMGLSVVALFFVGTDILSAFNWLPIIVGLIVGSVIGAFLAIKIEMTSMPQLVAVFNGLGGLASVLVVGAHIPPSLATHASIATAATGLIGAVTFTGSLIAFGKLQELMSGNAILFAGQRVLNAAVAAACIGICVWISVDATPLAYWLLALVGGALGVLLTIPIGGADMPVVIALLNSYSGLAAAAAGFVMGSNVLIIAGSLVGASGLILTSIMCKAMNRSLTNVLFGVMGPTADGPSADEVYAGKVKSTSADEVAMLLDTAQRVVIVPGYGLAVAQAQHAVRDLASILEAKGAVVEFAIHPVAGRMPGHMNVLLAEANIDYDKLIEMDTINPTMEQVDLCMVIGANDVVNPVARTDPSSAIAGMPIIDVDKARTVIVVKRSLSPGFAGIPNPLFAAENALMLFGDGKKAILDTIAALKEG